MSPELEKAYQDASRPFIDGAITEAATKKRSWRYFLEVNSMCNLKCITCTKGNQEGFEHLNGMMDWDLMLKCIDKIKSENPEAIVFLYGNSEPFLHPRLPEVITEVKARGLRCELSTNLNYLKTSEFAADVLKAEPAFMIISLSGFTQEVYERGHCGGNIEKVKENMKVLGTLKQVLDSKVPIHVNYHLYKYNEHELPLMREFASSLGIGLFTSFARIISMENAIQACREDDLQSTDFVVEEGRPDWNTALPHTSDHFRSILSELKIPPQKAREMYENLPLQSVCPIGAGSMFTFIRHDGQTSLCACVADRRIKLTNYLDSTPEGLMEERVGHSICQQCMKYRLNLYFHLVDRQKWGST
jgi:MoaA/NifB/PqqE/SkfB family radical SAM enzyme